MKRYFQRQSYTHQPLNGDYILGRTGVSWSVDRSFGNGSVARLIEGAVDKKTATQEVIGAARADATDAWEPAGPGEFRLLKAHRPLK